MEKTYYNLSGGINQASTKTELGLDTKKIYWADAENIEILQNKGICRQKGNSLFLELPAAEAVTGLHEMFAGDAYRLLITTVSGKIYVYNESPQGLQLVDKTLSGQSPFFTNFLNGTIIASEADSPFYLSFDLEIDDCNLKDSDSNPIIVSSSAVYKGRVWFSSGSTIYYSALGTYNDFTTEEDAGYISDFYTYTAVIAAMKPYKDYLAVYKRNAVYLLSGSNPDNFAITLFANKGCIAPNTIVNVENCQYFLSNGIFALEQVGELNQIKLGYEISQKIKPELESFSPLELVKSFCVHYENRNQMWFFFPYSSQQYYHTVWINDYLNKAWYKRVIPQDITACTVFKYNVLTADKDGKIYREDYGTTFNGEGIKFLWKSPFFAIDSAHHRKMIDEFYFILDESYDNNFEFSVYKDYNSEDPDDPEKIYSANFEHLIWADDSTNEKLSCCWAKDNESVPIWSVNTNSLEKAEISEANYSVQLCIQGSQPEQACAIIGLQFREIYNDD